MFCPNCGKENPDDAKTCQECGKSLVAEKAATPSKPLPTKMIAGVIGVLAVVAILIVFLVNSANTINLNKYLIFETSGANGYGRVSIYFDEEKFVEDNGEKFKLSKEGKQALSKEYGFDVKELAEYLEDFSGPYLADEFISYGVDVEYERSTNLSNGDKVEYSFDLDEETLKYLDCKIKYKDSTYKVQGLEEVKQMDYFEKLGVSFSGISAEGRMNLNQDNIPSELNRIKITYDKINGLSNGDEVTITLDPDSIETNIAYTGYAPVSASRTYIVEGLDELITKVSQYSEEDMEYMISEAKDYLTAHIAKRWNADNSELVSVEHTGTWVLSPKKGASRNFTFLTFDLTVHMFDEENEFDRTETLTWYVCFTDTYSVNGKTNFENSKLNGADYYSDRVAWCRNGEESCWSYDELYYYGYKNIDAFINTRINSMVDNYVVDGGVLD